MRTSEYGSDFHLMSFNDLSKKIQFPHNSIFYGCGRYAINNLILKNKKKWVTLYMPDYFCYEVVNSIKTTGIKVKFYKDNPLNDDIKSINEIEFIKGDVLFRMNYFGIREFRDNSNFNVPVIEDHSHNLLSDWAVNSNADWCVASLRKTLPIPDGGIVWSPKGFKLEIPRFTKNHDKLVSIRKKGMELKSNYLLDINSIKKDLYLDKYRVSESLFNKHAISAISEVSKSMLSNMPNTISDIKRLNFELLKSQINFNKVSLLTISKHNNPFSFVLIFNSTEDRNIARQNLIENKLYPAILWNIDNENASVESREFSKIMLSIHIDFRYDTEDIIEMSKIINNAINKISNEI